MRTVFLAASLIFASTTLAASSDIEKIVDDYIVPKYQTLATETADLAAAASRDCSADSAELVSAFHDAFDAWVVVSHLRFGPSEQDDRAFALAFWPDPRGSTPKALAALIRDEDPAVSTPEAFATVSIAARGFYALEYLLFADEFAETDQDTYQCALVQAVTTDIASNAADILEGWRGGYDDLMSNPDNDTYRDELEAAKQLFTSLSTGLEFTSNTRLGRPLGTFDRPRPTRAEAWRSGRALRHVRLSLASTRELAALLSTTDPDVDRAFDAAIDRASDLNDPVFAGVSEPQGRLRVEALQQKVDAIRQLLAEHIGPRLGIAAGFNALDGD